MAHRCIALLLVTVTSMACSGDDEPAEMNGEENPLSELESDGTSTAGGSTRGSRGMARGMGTIVGSSISTGGAGGGSNDTPSSEGMGSSGSESSGTGFAASSDDMPEASGAPSGSESGGPETDEGPEEGEGPATGDPREMEEEAAMMAGDTSGDPQAMADDQAMMAADAMAAAEMMNSDMAMDDAAEMDGTGMSDPDDMMMDDSTSTAGSPMVCDTYFEGISAMNAPGSEVMPNPGSWGQLPELLHQLPAGAELCGSYTVGGVAEFVAVASEADGVALRAHYDPILTGAGCTFFLETPVADAVSYAYTCPPEVGGVVSIGTSAGDIGIYLLSSQAL